MRTNEMMFLWCLSACFGLIGIPLPELQAQNKTESHTFRIHLEQNRPFQIPATLENEQIALNRLTSDNEAEFRIIHSEGTVDVTLRIEDATDAHAVVIGNIAFKLVHLDSTTKTATVDVSMALPAGQLSVHSSEIFVLQVNVPFVVADKNVVLQVEAIKNEPARAVISQRRANSRNDEARDATVHEGSYLFPDIFGRHGLKVHRITTDAVEILRIR